MAAPVVANTSTKGYGSQANTVVPVPTGTTTNDIVVVFFYEEDTNTLTVTPPANWTELTAWPTDPATTANGLTRQRVWWHRATAAESGSYTFTHTAVFTEAMAFRITGGNTTSAPVILGSTVTNTNSTTSGTITATTTTADTLLLYGVIIYTAPGGQTVSAPTGFTSAFNGNDLDTFSKAQAAVGTTGALSNTFSTATNSVTTLVGVLPLVVGQTQPAAATAAATASIAPSAFTQSRAETGTAAATASVGTTANVSRSLPIAATATATASVGTTAFTTISGAPAATAAATATSAGVTLNITYNGRGTAAVGTTAFVTERGTLTATAAASASSAGFPAKPGTVTATASATATNSSAFVINFRISTVTATAVATATLAGIERAIKLVGLLALDFFSSATIAPMKRRTSTAHIDAEAGGAPRSVTGMQAVASIDIGGSTSTVTLGPPGRLDLDVSVTGVLGTPQSLKTVLPVETNVTGNLRVVQSLTTILEEGLPALLPEPASMSVPEPQAEPAATVPVYNRPFFGLRT